MTHTYTYIVDSAENAAMYAVVRNEFDSEKCTHDSINYYRSVQCWNTLDKSFYVVSYKWKFHKIVETAYFFLNVVDKCPF